MKNSKVLELLEQGRIDELKAQLQDEIFTESLKTKPNAKKRYSAMKRYLKTISPAREIITKPCEVEFEGRKYNAFTNSYSLVLTTESCGEIEMCSEPDRYPNVARLIRYGEKTEKINFNEALAKAKSKGYKYTKHAIMSNEYLLYYEGAYFRAALVDVTYGLLDNGEDITVYYDGPLKPITIENEIGVAIILPIRYDGDAFDGVTVIEV